MIIDAIQCTNCQQVIYLRVDYDFHCCRCGKVCIDGEKEQPSITGKSWTIRPIELNATHKELYTDWNLGCCHYGWLEPGIEGD